MVMLVTANLVERGIETNIIKIINNTTRIRLKLIELRGTKSSMN